jgi:hypothetical protein
MSPYLFQVSRVGQGPFLFISLSLSLSLTKKFRFECLYCTGKLLLCMSQQIINYSFWGLVIIFSFLHLSSYHHLEHSVSNEASHEVNADASLDLDKLATRSLRYLFAPHRIKIGLLLFTQNAPAHVCLCTRSGWVGGWVGGWG